jgi:hypothetical protein
MAWQGMAWHGMAWHGMAWRGMAWHGMAGHGMAWQGMAGHGMAWQGMAWHGTANLMSGLRNGRGFKFLQEAEIVSSPKRTFRTGQHSFRSVQGVT